MIISSSHCIACENSTQRRTNDTIEFLSAHTQLRYFPMYLSNKYSTASPHKPPLMVCLSRDREKMMCAKQRKLRYLKKKKKISPNHRKNTHCGLSMRIMNFIVRSLLFIFLALLRQNKSTMISRFLLRTLCNCYGRKLMNHKFILCNCSLSI
jgi:hypothetical protein